MKFYIVEERGRKKIVAEKCEPGATPSALHEEVTLPSTFFMQLPKSLLNQRAKNAFNLALEERIAMTGNNNIIRVSTTKYGNTIRHNRMTYENNLDAAPNLRRIEAIHTEKHRIEQPERYASLLANDPVTASEGFETVKVKRHLVDGVSFSTLEQACHDNQLNAVTFVGFATFHQQPDMLFVTNDLDQVQQMLALCNAQDSTPIRRYTQWKWYYTSAFSTVLSHVVDLIAASSHVATIEFLSAFGEPLTDITHISGPPLRDTLVAAFSHLNADQEILNTIIAYTDSHEVSVCDVIQTAEPPHANRLHHLAISTDKAYVRSGRCGIMAIDSSPIGRTLCTESKEALLEQIKEEYPHHSPEEHVVMLNATLIPDAKGLVSHLYILSPTGLYYTTDYRNPITVEHCVINDSRIIQTIIYQLDGNSPDTFPLRALSMRELAVIKEKTKHQPTLLDTITFINRTANTCLTIPNLSPEKFQRFDMNLQLSIHATGSRILLFTEIAWLKNYLNHDALAIPEAPEEKLIDVALIVVPKPKNALSLDEKVQKADKKIRAFLALNNYKKFATALQDTLNEIGEDKRPDLITKLKSSLSIPETLFNKSINLKTRLDKFLIDFDNTALDHSPKKQKCV